MADSVESFTSQRGYELAVYADAESVAVAAAQSFVTIARKTLEKNACFFVALSGGSTPRRMFELLATEDYRESVDWPRVEFFWGDERNVAPENKDSNYRMAKEALLDHLDISAKQIHRMQAEREDLDAAAEDYAQTIADHLNANGEGSLPKFDLIFLGMGDDGHTASLFPHTEALQEKKRWCVNNLVPQLATQRLTLTYSMINAAHNVIFLAAGANKAKRLAEVIDGPRELERLPSQGICPGNGKLLWLVDQAAAANLAR